MKNKLVLSLCLSFCLLCLFGVALAEKEAIHSVNISVTLLENGDAELTEVWDVTVVSGTEWYLALNNMQNMTIVDLYVTDESGRAYTYIDKWDVSRSIEEKAYTYGIIQKKNDYELCWGVGSYGRHQFTINYKITNLVKRYSDGIGFNHTFLSKGLSSSVAQASVTIAHAVHSLNDTNTKIWAFGYDGNIGFKDNKIFAQNSEPITKKQGITIMAEFDEPMYWTLPLSEGSFDKIKNKAFDGSDYEETISLGPEFWIVFIGIMGLLALLIIYLVLRSSLPDVYYQQNYHQTRATMKSQAPPNNTFPFEGNIQKTIGLLAFFKETPPAVSIITRYLLEWMRQGAISFRQEGDQNIIIFNYAHHSANRLEDQLYEMLRAAASNGALSQKATEKWAYKNHSEINAWYNAYTKEAAAALILEDITLATHLRRGIASGLIEVLNQKGWDLATQMYGFKNYLRALTRQPDDGISDELLDDYVSYAAIFKLNEQADEWYGNPYSDSYSGVYPYGYYYMHRSFHKSYQKGVSRHEGGGGSASSGGGGGSSGGGGGGSR